jgi:hypothetical protein
MGEADTIAARELVLYIENNEALYRRQLQPIIQNLARKMTKGLYDKTKAIKLWGYLADSGAKEYNKEFGDGTLSLKMFDKPTRLFTAELLEKYFYEGVVEQNPRKTPVRKTKGLVKCDAVLKRTLIKMIEGGIELCIKEREKNNYQKCNSHLSYVQGVIETATKTKCITAAEKTKYINQIKQIIK